MKLGFDPICFRTQATRMGEIGCIISSVGINVFAIQGVKKTLHIHRFSEVTPFFVANMFNLVLLVSVPQISLLLPGMMKYRQERANHKSVHFAPVDRESGS